MNQTISVRISNGKLENKNGNKWTLYFTDSNGYVALHLNVSDENIKSVRIDVSHIMINTLPLRIADDASETTKENNFELAILTGCEYLAQSTTDLLKLVYFMGLSQLLNKLVNFIKS